MASADVWELLERCPGIDEVQHVRLGHIFNNPLGLNTASDALYLQKPKMYQ